MVSSVPRLAPFSTVSHPGPRSRVASLPPSSAEAYPGHGVPDGKTDKCGIGQDRRTQVTVSTDTYGSSALSRLCRRARSRRSNHTSGWRGMEERRPLLGTSRAWIWVKSRLGWDRKSPKNRLGVYLLSIAMNAEVVPETWRMLSPDRRAT